MQWERNGDRSSSSDPMKGVERSRKGSGKAVARCRKAVWKGSENMQGKGGVGLEKATGSFRSSSSEPNAEYAFDHPNMWPSQMTCEAV